MTTSATTGDVLEQAAPAFTVAEVLEVIVCPLCGVAGEPGCHPLSRLRVAVRLAAEAVEAGKAQA